MTAHADQLGRCLEFEEPPRRIVSLVPSQTELLFDLGFGERVAGVTRFCVHPEHARRQCAFVGGTKSLKLERIAGLQPDFILANKEENRREDIDWLAERFPVWVSDVSNLPQALAMIRAIGAICQGAQAAEFLCGKIERGFAGIEPLPGPRAVYLIWREPWMSVGADTFIHDLLQRCGLDNLLAHAARYPELGGDELGQLRPDLLLLSSEPFPFQEKHRAELQAICPGSRIELVDGEMFSWYGSRLERAARYLQLFCNSHRDRHAFHPEQRILI